MRLVKLAAAGLFLLLSLSLGVLAFPEPLFAYSMSHGNFRVWSDRPLGPAVRPVLDDAARRMETSELHDPDAVYRLFVCNEPWRMRIYSQRLGATPGGVTDGWLTRNIYLREVDFANNRMIPPSGILADADARPLSYFIAHEATHVMQSRAFGRFMALRHPDWLVEGYADLVAKAGDFDFEENRRLLRTGDPRLDYGRSGLYRRYHLMVALLVERKQISIRRLFADPPPEAAIIEELESRDYKRARAAGNSA